MTEWMNERKNERMLWEGMNWDIEYIEMNILSNLKNVTFMCEDFMTFVYVLKYISNDVKYLLTRGELPYWFTSEFLPKIFNIFPSKVKNIVSGKVRCHDHSSEKSEKQKMSVWVETLDGHLDKFRSNLRSSLDLDLYFFWV